MEKVKMSATCATSSSLLDIIRKRREQQETPIVAPVQGRPTSIKESPITNEKIRDKKAYIDERGCLVIPHDGDPKYHWWADGQSIKDTLIELKASREVWELYVPRHVPYRQDGNNKETEMAT